MTVTDSSSFSVTQFSADFKKLADAIGAPYSESTIQESLTTFEECFREGTVIWRTTNRPNDVVNYRFYLRRRLDTVEMATKAGYLEPGNPMGRLATSWSALFNGDTEQWCDFHPKIGLVKTWVHLKCRRLVDDVLAASEVPEAVRAHTQTFRRLGLEQVRFASVDYDGASVNLYFTARGPLSESQAAQYTDLAQCGPPTEQEFQDMRAFLSSQGFLFAVTMDYKTGEVKRVAFYANLPGKELPAVNDRLKLFFTEAISHDKQHMRIVAWSYGVGDKKYMKAESSYVGDFATLLKDVGSPLLS